MSKFVKFIVAADNHGEIICPTAERKFLDFCERWKPKHRIHLGDLWDFSPLRNGASAEDMAAGVSMDFTKGLEFLDAYKPTHLALGNHDDRIWQKSTTITNGIMRETCAKLARSAEEEFKERGIEWVPYHVEEYLQMPEGGPKIIHGFRATMYPAKAHFENWGSCIFGHCHKPDTYVGRHIDGGIAHGVGCLADLSEMHYSDRQPSRLGHRQGWMYGLINSRTGHWQAWHVINEEGAWLSPEGIL